MIFLWHVAVYVKNYLTGSFMIAHNWFVMKPSVYDHRLFKQTHYLGVWYYLAIFFNHRLFFKNQNFFKVHIFIKMITISVDSIYCIFVFVLLSPSFYAAKKTIYLANIYWIQSILFAFPPIIKLQFIFANYFTFEVGRNTIICRKNKTWIV